jgi:hypothetical protein
MNGSATSVAGTSVTSSSVSTGFAMDWGSRTDQGESPTAIPIENS